MPNEGFKFEKEEIKKISDPEIKVKEGNILDDEKEEKIVEPEIKNESLNSRQEKVIESLNALFEEKNPLKINRKWILDNDKVLCGKIRYNFGKCDIAMSFVDNKWKERYAPMRFNIPISEVVKDIVETFELEKPSKISSKWIEDKLDNDYQRLRRIMERDEEGNINCQPLLDLLPEYIAKCWEPRIKNISLQKLAIKFINIFEQEKPDQISSRWLEKKSRQDYRVILTRIGKDKNSRSNWKKFTDLLPEDMAKCWKPPTKNMDELISEEPYFDSEETDTVVNKHRDKMYVFYTLIDKEKDRDEREKIVKEMREIILKGNIDALDRLIGHLLFTTEKWIEDDPELEIYKYAKEEVKKIITRCIYRHDPAKGKFSSYLYISLVRNTLRLRQNSLGLNLKKKFADGKAEYHNNSEEKR